MFLAAQWLTVKWLYQTGRFVLGTERSTHVMVDSKAVSYNLATLELSSNYEN